MVEIDKLNEVVNGKVSFKDKLKAKMMLANIYVKNRRLILQYKVIQQKAGMRRDKCKECKSKFIEIAKPKYTNKKVLEMINNRFFCDKCTPIYKEYMTFRINLKASDVKL